MADSNIKHRAFYSCIHPCRESGHLNFLQVILQRVATHTFILVHIQRNKVHGQGKKKCNELKSKLSYTFFFTLEIFKKKLILQAIST